MDQWNRKGSPEINLHTYSQLIFDKGGKNIQWRKASLFRKWYWEIWAGACESIKLRIFHYIIYKNKLKMTTLLKFDM